MLLLLNYAHNWSSVRLSIKSMNLYNILEIVCSKISRKILQLLLLFKKKCRT